MKEILIRNLVTSLLIADKGMSAFAEPLPEGIKEHLIKAVASFGSDALLEIHSTINNLKGTRSIISLIDILGLINDPSSMPILIDIHKNYSGDFEGIATIVAMKSIKHETGYLYFSEIISKYANGDFRAINNRTEIDLICEALGEWQDEQAIRTLKTALNIKHLSSMPHTAIIALAKHDSGKVHLSQIKGSMPDYLDLIESLL